MVPTNGSYHAPWDHVLGPEWQGRTSKELQDALYDEDGLPV
jgi:hypothetical protein